MCDSRIASEAAYFEQLERRFIEVVYAPLHDLLGGSLARELCLTGRRVLAEEACRIGLVSETVHPDELRDGAMALAQRIAESPREVLTRMKAKFIRRAGIAGENTAEL